MMHPLKSMVALVAVTVLLESLALAAEERPSRPGPGSPPPEAIQACKNRYEGDPVTFTVPTGEKIKANCRKIKDQLIAVPEGAPERPDGPPPEERRKEP